MKIFVLKIEALLLWRLFLSNKKATIPKKSWPNERRGNTNYSNLQIAAVSMTAAKTMPQAPLPVNILSMLLAFFPHDSKDEQKKVYDIEI